MSSGWTIVYATTNTTTGLQRIAPGGGEPAVLTRPDPTHGEVDHVWPELLPGGQAVLFTITATTGDLDQAQVAVFDLRTATQTTLIRGGSDAHFVRSAHLVYGAAGTLRTVALDVARLTVVGAPVTVIPQVGTTISGATDVAMASDATLVYVPSAVVAGGAGGVQNTLVWVDRQGQEAADFRTAPRVRSRADLTRRHWRGARHQRPAAGHLAIGPGARPAHASDIRQ